MPKKTARFTAGGDAKERILRAAALLFANNGFDAIGIRAIAAQAGVNIAAVNYHFGSKEGLVTAVCEKHIRETVRLRAEALDRAEAAGPLTPESILDAYVRPSLARMTVPDDPNALLGRLVIAHATKERSALGPVLTAALAPSTRRFAVAMTEAMPEADPIVLTHGMHLTIGAMLHMISWPEKLAELFPGLPPDADVDARVNRLVVFSAAGLRALAAANPPAKK